MKSRIVTFVFGLGFVLNAYSNPVFTTNDPIGRLITSKAEDQYLSYFCLERTEGTNGEFKGNPKCHVSQYAVSTKAGTINVDAFGNITRENGSWTPIGPVFTEATVTAFQNRMKANHAEAFEEVWAGLFNFSTGWQDKALVISKRSLKEFIAEVASLHSGPDYSWDNDPTQFASVGRVIENKSNGETIDLACLEAPVPGTPCQRYQLRYTHDGVTELVGVPMTIRIPKEKFKNIAGAESNSYYEGEKPEYNSGMPFLAAAVKKRYDGAAHYFGYPAIGTFFVWGTAAAISGVALGPAFAIGVGIVAVLPAVDITAAAGRNAVKATRRFVLSAQARHQLKRISKNIDHLFEGAEVGENSIRLKNRSFQILKSALVQGSGV